MREYIVPAENITLANQAVTAVYLNPAAGTVIEVIRAWAAQAANATSAQQRIELATKASVYPTLVSQAPVKTKTGDPASGIVGGTAGAAGTSGINASAEGAGTHTTLIPDAFNVLNGWLWVPNPNETLMFRAAESLGCSLQFPAAPTTLTNWNAGLTFRELG